MLGTDVSLGFTSIAGLQVLPLVLAEIWEPFQLNSSWFLISQDTPQVCYPKIHRTTCKSVLSCGDP